MNHPLHPSQLLAAIARGGFVPDPETGVEDAITGTVDGWGYAVGWHAGGLRAEAASPDGSAVYEFEDGEWDRA